MNIFELLHAVHKQLGIHNHQSSDASGEKWFLRKYLRGLKSPVVFDVGAHVGSYARDVLDACPTAKIHAFEPAPDAFATLKKNLKKTSVKTLNLGLSNKAGKAKIFDREDSPGKGFASLYRHIIEDLHHTQAIETEVKLDTLGNVFEKKKIKKIHLLKIDTEGHELKVLQGAKKLIRDRLIDVIQIEINEMNVVSRVFLKDFHDLLVGYRFFRLVPSGVLDISEYKP